MLELHEALQVIKSIEYPTQTEKVSLIQANYRILAQDVFHDMNMPPFNKSAMDGYACKKEDLAKELSLTETIYAGKTPTQNIESGQCAKIMTGAMVPVGADCVFMKEDSEELANGKIVCHSPRTKENICYLGEDITEGQQVLSKGTLITAKHIPTLASAGVDQPLVYCQPKITILATGTELVEPGMKPSTSQIRNTNSSQMLAQINNLGIQGNYGGIVPDTPEDTERMIKDALEVSDLIVLTGGVSVGEYDFTQHILKKLGFEVLISTIATQPGRPLIFAKRGDQYAFGLAGNPVSSYIQFDIYVKPFIYQLMNFDFPDKTQRATLMEKLKRKKADRLKLIPAILDGNNEVRPVDYHGSAHINALGDANCIVEIPLNVYEINEGEQVNIRLI